MNDIIARVVRGAAILPTWLAVAALFLMMGLTFFDVVLRSTFNAPIEAATELTRILMAVVVFSALPIISAAGTHISVDLLDGFFSRIARWRDALVNLACGAMLWLPAERVVVLAERAQSYGDVTEYLGIPQFYMAWFIAVFTYCTSLALVLRGLCFVFLPKVVNGDND